MQPPAWTIGPIHITEEEDPDSPLAARTQYYVIKCVSREHPVFEDAVKSRDKAMRIAEVHLAALHSGKLFEVLAETRAKADDLEYRLNEAVSRLRSIGR